MHVAHWQIDFNISQAQQSIQGMLDQLMVQRAVQTMILAVHATARYARRHGWIVENRREVEAAGFPMINSGFHLDHIDAANHFIDGAESKLRHILPQLFRNEEKEIDHMLGLPLELFAQHRILCGNAHRTSVEMALPHHDAAHRDQRSSSKSELFGAQQRSNSHVAARLQLAVGLHADAAAQIVQQQDLLSFRQS